MTGRNEDSKMTSRFVYLEEICLCVVVVVKLGLSQTTTGLTCDLLKIPTWLAIDYNVSSQTPVWELHYSCEYGYQFKDTKKEDKSTIQTKTSLCTLHGWQPSVEVCIPINFKELDPQYAEPVEAKNSRIIGTAAIVFLICECIILILLDIPIWKRVFCSEIPKLVKKHYGVSNVMHVAQAATKFKARKKSRRQSEMPMLTRREMLAKKLIL